MPRAKRLPEPIYVPYVLRWKGSKFLDLKNQRFGKLTALTPFRRLGKAGPYWRCICECGKISYVSSQNLANGYTSSCGCLRIDRIKAKARYERGTPTYWVWRAMKGRCTNEKDPAYKNYGGRGIQVCSRWETFANFLADMGTAPEGKWLDRVDNDGNYEPDNCQWATPAQQMLNKRNNVLVKYKNETITLKELSTLTGIKYGTLYARIKTWKWPVGLATKAVLVFVLLIGSTASLLASELKMVTASEKGTYIQICRDLSTHVTPDAGLDLECLPSAGSVENIKLLRFEPGVKFAILQSDVMSAFAQQADLGNKAAAVIARPLRVITPLYAEESYLIVRADSTLNYIHEIKDTKINAGPIGSGTALSTLTMYRAMFGQDLPPTTTNMSNEDALVKLTTDKSIDVVVVVGGQPMKLLSDMRPEAKQLIKILKFDPTVLQSKQLLKTYFPAVIKQASYPNLLDADQPGIAVKAYLVTYDYNLQQTQGLMRKFAHSLCTNFESLRKFGHPKWKEVVLGLPELGEGWTYYKPTADEITRCIAPKPEPKPAKPVPPPCSQQERILGLCGK